MRAFRFVLKILEQVALNYFHIALGIVLFLLLPAVGSAAPYGVFAIYSSGTQRKEVAIDDLMTKPDDNVMIPEAFTGEDGVRYSLNSIEERLDQSGVGKSYAAPFWDFTVDTAIDGTRLDDPYGKILNAKTATRSWTLTDFLARAKSRSLFTVSIETKGSFAPQYLCGLEAVYRDQKGKAPEAAMGALLDQVDTRKPGKLVKVISSGTHPILFSFCDSYLQGAGTDSINWGEALKHKEFSLGRADSTETLRAAHKRALVDALFGDSLDTNGLTIATVAAPESPTNLVIDDHLSFSIVSLNSLVLTERGKNESRRAGGSMDQDAVLTLNFDSLQVACGLAVAPPYSIVLTTTDDKNNPIVIKPPLTGSTCTPELNVKWSDYLGKTMRVALMYQLPGSGGKVLIGQSDQFTVRQLGVIMTLPVYSEIVSAASSPNPKSLTSTSSVPISWAIRLNSGQAKFAAITFPWRISVNTRDTPEFAKYFSLYPHVTIIVPADGSVKPTYALGIGVSLAQVFNFAYGISPVDKSSFLLVGLSVQDVVKALN